MNRLYLVAACIAVGVAQEAIPSVQELKIGNLLFSAKTYTELTKINENNFLVCPLSVSVILALVEAGAGGRTAQQLLSGLNLPDNDEKTQEAYKAISPTLNKKGEYNLTSANKIYLKNDFEINSHFQQVATDVFNAELEKVDFGKDDTVDKINGWVLEKTQKKISDLISRKDIDQATRAVLINALYFHGDWLIPFTTGNTQIRDFHAVGERQVKVNMMEQTNSFNYYEDSKLNAKFLEMGYKGGDISLTLVLPNDVNGLPLLESKIADVLKQPQYNYERVHVQIPSIKVESVIRFIPILQNFGIQDLFNPNANLTGMSDRAENLYVSKVVQKAFIEITEEGTIAAAATAVVVLPGFPAPPPFPPKEFNANHPFIFYLKYPHGILFVGRYVGSDK